MQGLISMNFLSIIMRVCRNCGSYPGNGQTMCSVCRATYKNEVLSQWNSYASFAHNVLYNLEGKHSKDLISLKENKNSLFAKFLIVELLNKRALLTPFLPVNPIVVPAPSSTGRTHAHRLASVLCDLTGWEYRDCLTKEASNQKLKSRFERQDVKVVLNENVPSRNVILVDDLVTTGATALACKKALKNAKSFEVWAPYRTVLLCENSGSDITRADEKTRYSNNFNVSHGQRRRSPPGSRGRGPDQEGHHEIQRH